MTTAQIILVVLTISATAVFVFIELRLNKNTKKPMVTMNNQSVEEMCNAILQNAIAGLPTMVPMKTASEIHTQNFDRPKYKITDQEDKPPKIPRGWTRHDGKECKLKLGTNIEVIRRNGAKETVVISMNHKGPSTFVHNGFLSTWDVIAYRIIKPKKSKKRVKK